MSDSLFLDSNAGVPLRPKVAEELRRFLLDRVGSGLNASGLYPSSKKLRVALAEVRDQVRDDLALTQHEVIFTSSGTEALVSAHFALIREFDQAPWYWVRSQIEHPAIYAIDPFFSRPQGVLEIPTRPSGEWSSDALLQILEKLEREHPDAGVLLSVIAVQNESGVIQDIEGLKGLLARFPQVRVVLDAAQAWQKWRAFAAPLLGSIDAIALSGAKVGALPGTGVLLFSKKRPYRALMSGTQEQGRRGGTENTLGILSLGMALRGGSLLESRSELKIRNQIESELRECFGERVTVWGADAKRRLHQTLLFSIEGLSSLRVLDFLAQEGIEASAGSACSSGTLKPSPVVLAMGGSEDQARGAVRFSWDQPLRELELERLFRALHRMKGLLL